jgi:hypothetical protein
MKTKGPNEMTDEIKPCGTFKKGEYTAWRLTDDGPVYAAPDVDALRARAEAAEARVVELREALIWITEVADIGDAEQIARAALAKENGK